MGDSTQGRFFSHIESCFAITLDGNVSNGYAGYLSHSRANVGELEPSNSVTEELDLATLANV